MEIFYIIRKSYNDIKKTFLINAIHVFKESWKDPRFHKSIQQHNCFQHNNNNNNNFSFAITMYDFTYIKINYFKL